MKVVGSIPPVSVRATQPVCGGWLGRVRKQKGLAGPSPGKRPGVDTRSTTRQQCMGLSGESGDMLKTVTGEFGKLDRATMSTLQGVLA